MQIWVVSKIYQLFQSTHNIHSPVPNMGLYLIWRFAFTDIGTYRLSFNEMFRIRWSSKMCENWLKHGDLEEFFLDTPIVVVANTPINLKGSLKTKWLKIGHSLQNELVIGFLLSIAIEFDAIIVDYSNQENWKLFLIEYTQFISKFLVAEYLYYLQDLVKVFYVLQRNFDSILLSEGSETLSVEFSHISESCSIPKEL